MEKHYESQQTKVGRALDLVLTHDPIDIETVDRTLNNPELLREKYGETMQYFGEIENRVEQNANQLQALLPYMDEPTKEFIAAWEAQELVHGAIFDQAMADIGMTPYAFDPSDVSRGFKLGGELSRIPDIDKVLQFLYLTTGALHERLTAKGYIGLIDSLKQDGEIALAETAVKPINRQEGKHLGYYKEAALVQRDKLSPWQLALAREIKTRTYAPVGAMDNKHKMRFGKVIKVVRGDHTVEEMAEPVQKVAEQLFVDEKKQFLLLKLGKKALQRFTPASEVAIEMLEQKVNGLPLPKFVEKALYDCIEREKEEEIRRQTEGFAVPVQ